MQSPSLEARVYHPGQWADALGDATGFVRLQENRNPVVRLKRSSQELQRRLTVGNRPSGASLFYGFVSTTLPVKVNSEHSLRAEFDRRYVLGEHEHI